MARSNFYFLFVGLLAVLGVEPFLQRLADGPALIQLTFSAILVVGVFSLAGRVFYLGLGLAVVAVASSLGHLRTGSAALHVIDLVAIVSFCLLAIVVKVRQVLFMPGAITLNRVVGALCIYLLLGILWAILFNLVAFVDPGAFRYVGSETEEPVEHFIYYSFVTLTTLGYGDVAPVHPVARTLAYLEAVTGQLYVAVLIAGLVGRHVAARSGDQSIETR